MNLQNNSWAVKRYSKVIKLATWMQNLPNKITPAPFRLIQIGSAFWQSRALYVGTRLGIADELADNKKSAKKIARKLDLHEDNLYRLMRMLASIGIFNETSPGIFSNSKMSNYLREDNPNNVRAMILMHNSPEMTVPWFQSLEESIRDGEIPFKKSNNIDLFEYMDKNTEFDILFSQAMDSVENITGNQFLNDFKWGKFRRLIDVGGSNGSKALSILKSNPNLQAVVFDRPQIIGQAKNKWKSKQGIPELQRVEFIGGDIFESLPPAESDEDAYLFMAIFHTFDDTACRKILSRLTEAIGDKSPTIVIADAVADEVGIDSITASMDMQMLMGSKGRERTMHEWQNLFNGTRFRIKQVVEMRTFAKYLVLCKI